MTQGARRARATARAGKSAAYDEPAAATKSRMARAKPVPPSADWRSPALDESSRMGLAPAFALERTLSSPRALLKPRRLSARHMGFDRTTLLVRDVRHWVLAAEAFRPARPNAGRTPVRVG